MELSHSGWKPPLLMNPAPSEHSAAAVVRITEEVMNK